MNVILCRNKGTDAQAFWSAVAERSGTALRCAVEPAGHLADRSPCSCQSGVAASLCHRTPKGSRAEIIPGDSDRLKIRASVQGSFPQRISGNLL